MTTKASMVIEFDQSTDAVWNAALTALRDSRCGLRNVDSVAHTATAEFGLTLWSWGENIVLEVGQNGASGARVTLKSTSKLRTTLFDWGKNKRNLRKILSYLHASLRSAQTRLVQE